MSTPSTTTTTTTTTTTHHVTEYSFDHQGCRLHAFGSGSGPALVYVHGCMADHRAAEHRAGHLREHLRLIAPDVRGAGRSHWHRPWTWSELSDDLAALLDHLEIEQAIIAGYSGGSAIALRFALDHAPRVRALVLDSPVYPGHARPFPPALNAAFAGMLAAAERAAVEGTDALLPLYERLDPERRAVAIAMARDFDPKSVLATVRGCASGRQPFEDIDELARLTMPCTIITGGDPQHPAEVAELHGRAIPRARRLPAGTRLEWSEIQALLSAAASSSRIGDHPDASGETGSTCSSARFPQ